MVKRFIYAVAAAISLGGAASSAQAFDQEHSEWKVVLDQYLTEDLMVHYDKLTADVKKNKEHPLLKYLDALEKVKVAEYDAWSRENQMAFLINAYNAFTLKYIVDHYPVDSILEIGNFLTRTFKRQWKVEIFDLLGGKMKTLDDIEHVVLRPDFKDYRIHAAVNCASISCPVLRNEPYTGEKLDAQLDDQMRQWMNDPMRTPYQKDGEDLKISMIFKWYPDDFEDWGGGVQAVIEKYGPPEAKSALENGAEIAYEDYNWKLNRAE